MSGNRVRPADVLLDLLRSVGTRGHSVRQLVRIGGLFGFTENGVRVTLSRLLARGLVESPQRGRYRLAAGTDAINEFVERWRLGEERVRPWTPGDWLFAHEAEPTPRSRWALEALGFREAGSGLYLRPDNLQLDIDDLHALGTGIGLDPRVLMIVGRPRGAPVPDAWVGLWQPGALVAHQRELLYRLATSNDRLAGMSRDDARLETFRLGGEVIHALAKDPLLPEELVETGVRAELWRAMLDYDARGKAIWASSEGEKPGTMPVPQLAMSSTAG